MGSSLEHQSLKACPQLIRTGSPWNGGEGPASSNDYSLPQVILNALTPDIGQRNSVATSQQPPSNLNDALKSQEAFEAALNNLKNSADPSVAALPESWRRTFHPKGTAYSHHSEANINYILSNRQANAAPPPLHFLLLLLPQKSQQTRTLIPAVIGIKSSSTTSRFEGGHLTRLDWYRRFWSEAAD